VLKLSKAKIPLVLPSFKNDRSEHDMARIFKEGLNILQHYLRFDTTNPPGHTWEAVQYLKSIFEKQKIKTRIYASDGKNKKANLVATLKNPGRKPLHKPLVLMHHIDVVPADPGDWKADPFSAKLKEGSVWARGALDTKALGIMELAAMILINRDKEMLNKLKRDIVYLAVCDEETGGEKGARWMVDRFWKDLDADAVINEGGFCSRGIFTNDETMVIGISICEKQALWLKLISKGRPGHGSMPPEHSANDKLLAALNQFHSMINQEEVPNPTFSAMKNHLGSIKNSDYTRALQRNTITLTSLSSGVGTPPKANVIPAVATATIDCRFSPDQDWKHFLTEMNAIALKNDVELEVIKGPEETSGESSPDHPLYRSLERAFRNEIANSLVVPILLSGATDSRFFRAKGVPAFGIGPFILEEPDLSLIHGPDERIKVNDFYSGIKILTDVLRDYCLAS